VSNLYFAARINDDIRGVHPSSTKMQLDDSVEIFFDGDHDRMSGTYNTDDHMFVITADGRSEDLVYGLAPQKLPASVVFAVGQGPSSGWTVEVQIPWSVLGSLPANGGRLIGFDLGIGDDDNVSTQMLTHSLFWKFVTPTSGCTTSPSCNTQIFGTVELLGH
jgi:hypothetical protein